jgi:hypothetical protein
LARRTGVEPGAKPISPATDLRAGDTSVTDRGNPMGFFKKKADDTRYVICQNCGAGYNTGMVAMSILSQSAFLADLDSWNTKILCRNCRGQVWVSGSHTTVFGQPKP